MITVSDIVPVKNYTNSSRRKNFSLPVIRTVGNSENNNSVTYHYLGKENLLENKDFAFEYFEKNYKAHKPLFGSVEDFSLIEKNEAIKRNFCEFWVKKSQEELENLSKNRTVSPETAQKYRGYRQINEFFKEYLSLLPELKQTNNLGMVSFAGQLNFRDETHCKNLVHGYAGACSLISAGAGAMNMGSADTWALRGLQGLMFFKMADYLDVPFLASTEYMAKELYSGAVLGTEGAKILTDVVGGFLHASSVATGATVASGGSSHAMISGSTGAIHGSLSFMITEKMGRGFIKRVKANQMTFKNQSIELASYFGTRAIFGGDLKDLFDMDFDIGVDDAFDPENIKQAYESIPVDKKELLSSVMDLLKDYNANKLGISFTFNFVSRCLINKKNIHSKEDLKKQMKEAFKDSLILTAVYDIFDYGVGQVASENAKETIQDIQQNLDKYPEVNNAYKNAQEEFFKNIDMSKINSHDFQKHFTNKMFLSNVSFIMRGKVKEFIDKCRERKNEQHAKDLKAYNEQKQDLENYANSQQSQENKNIANLIEDYKKSLNIQQTAMTSKKSFGYNKIAGYDEQKSRISQLFLAPVFIEKTTPDIFPPKGLLLFGPTNTGKTTLATGIAEQGMCKLYNIPVFKSDESIKVQLEKCQQNARNVFEKKKQRTIIKIDEIEALNRKPESLNTLLEILNDENSRVSLIATTNEPSLVDKKILKGLIKIYMPPANKKDIQNIFSYYTDDKIRETINYEKIAQTILDKNKIFSNRQLQAIVEQINQLKTMSQDDINKIIDSITPEITEDNLKKYEGE